MKTRIANPFADDAVNILEWAYGMGARIAFNYNVAVGQRYGQAFMNVLFDHDAAEYDRLTGSLVDPFHDDKKLPAALDKLTSK